MKDELGVVRRSIRTRLTRPRRENDTNNKTVEGKSFSKDEDENHSNKELRLLCIGPECIKYRKPIKHVKELEYDLYN